VKVTGRGAILVVVVLVMLGWGAAILYVVSRT
jgi:hypothetical protein